MIFFVNYIVGIEYYVCIYYYLYSGCYGFRYKKMMRTVYQFHSDLKYFTAIDTNKDGAIDFAEANESFGNMM